jgi:hypothetical protein
MLSRTLHVDDHLPEPKALAWNCTYLRQTTSFEHLERFFDDHSFQQAHHQIHLGFQDALSWTNRNITPTRKSRRSSAELGVSHLHRSTFRLATWLVARPQTTSSSTRSLAISLGSPEDPIPRWCNSGGSPLARSPPDFDRALSSSNFHHSRLMHGDQGLPNLPLKHVPI